MKNWIVLAGLLSGLLSAGSAQATTVRCSAKISGKVESFNARISPQGRIIWWSKTQLVDATRGSAFASLADMDNFGLEGSAAFLGKNGYSILSVTNTAESIDIGVSRDLKLGFYNYRDGGSGAGNSRTPLTCQVMSKSPAL